MIIYIVTVVLALCLASASFFIGRLSAKNSIDKNQAPVCPVETNVKLSLETLARMEAYLKNRPENHNIYPKIEAQIDMCADIKADIQEV